MSGGFEFPEDLVDLQRRRDAAGARVGDVLSRLPSAVEIIAGRAEVSPELAEELARARRDELDLVMPLMRHQWWKDNGNRTTAKTALREAARPTASVD